MRVSRLAEIMPSDGMSEVNDEDLRECAYTLLVDYFQIFCW